jgi:hypothetical protein
MAPIDRARRTRIGKSLRSKRDAPRGRERNSLSHAVEHPENWGRERSVISGGNRDFAAILPAFFPKHCQELKVE